MLACVRIDVAVWIFFFFPSRQCPNGRRRRRGLAPFDCLLGSTEILSSCQPVSRSVTNYRESLLDAS